MAMQTASPPTTPSALVVGNAFVEQYYRILHNSPDLVYRFYQDSSVLSRPDSNGEMISVTTMEGINEKICSLDYKEYKAEIKTADAQKSYMDGVTVLVTGCLTGKDKLRRKFAQSFFLAPQDNGYFVLNDVFRYVEDGEPWENHPVNGVDDTPEVPLTTNPEPTIVPDHPAPDPPASLGEENQKVVEKAYEPSDHEKQLVNEKEDVTEPQSHSNVNDVAAVVETASSSPHDDAPKKSYASIVKVMRGSSGITKAYVPANTVKVANKKTEHQSVGSAAPAPVPEASAPSSSSTLKSSNAKEEIEGYSIYIRNLPLNVTDDQVEVEFKKFGPINQGGIQVRNHKQEYCYAFVEYQSLSSMNAAIQASPITIAGCQAVVELKRTTTQVGSGRGGRYPSGRGGFRNYNFRGRGNYGDRSFGRNEYGNRGDYSGRGRGPAGRGGENYQQGRGRTDRPFGPRQNVTSA